jgi:hypothetical protein
VKALKTYKSNLTPMNLILKEFQNKKGIPSLFPKTKPNGLYLNTLACKTKQAMEP